jgi:Pyrimidine dimer DNA glycosylase
MRLWTLHPRYLDAKGLVAAWREGLLAQKVLAGGTRGYRNHPQLARFRAHEQPGELIAAFLVAIAEEAARREYQFDITKISPIRFTGQIHETRGQLLYEWTHLKSKLRIRSPKIYRQILRVRFPESHPLFLIIPGKVQEWEKGIDETLKDSRA